MNINITGRNIEITDGLRNTVTEKLGKLERYFKPETDVNVTLSVEKERQKIEVTIPVKGRIIRSEQESNDMYVSIDLVEEVIERQLRKYKNKIIDKKQSATLTRTTWRARKSRSSARSASISSRCTRKTPAYRWSCSATTSSSS